MFLHVLKWEEGSGGLFETALHLGLYVNVDKHWQALHLTIR